MADNIKIVNKQNKATIIFPNGITFVGDADGEFVAANGTDGTDSVKVTRAEDSKVLFDIDDYTRIVDTGDAQIGATRDLTVSNLNSNFLNPGTSITNLGDVTEASNIDKTQGKKLHLVMDSSNKFVVTNVADTQLDNATLIGEVLANGNAKIKLTKSQSNGITAIDSALLIKGTGISLGTQGGNITISGFSGNYSDLSGAPSLGAVATSNDYNDLTNLPTIPTDTNTNIGNTDMTLTGARSVNMSGNDLTFKDGNFPKLVYDDSDDEWEFSADSVKFFSTSSTQGGQIKLCEAAQGGNDAITLKAPDSPFSSVTFTLPTVDGANGEVLKTNGSGVLSFSSALDGNPTLQAASIADLNGEDFTINVNGGNFFVKEASSTRLQVDQTDVVIQGLTFPTSDGSAGQVLKTNGSGVLSFVDQTTDTTELANDSSPQLGGDLDVNGNKITSASNGDIVIDPNGTGKILLQADEIRTRGNGSVGVGIIKLYEGDILPDDNFVALQAPISLASDLTFTLPSTDGSNGQVLKTNGSGTLSFTTVLTGVNDTITGVTQVKDAGATRGTVSFYDDAGDNFTALRAADTLSADTVFHLPDADGSAGQFIKTDGSGNLSFGDAGGGTTLTQVYSQSFLDNIGTTKHYLPFKDINEQTTIYQEEAAMFMPFDGKVRSVSIRIPAITGTSGNMTIGVHTINTGNTGLFSSAAWTTEETETVAVATTDDHRSIHFVFDDAQHFEAGDLLAISIQCSTSLFGGSKYVYVSTIIDYDTSNTMPSTSQVLSSNP